jgi:hypothetical protein
MTYKGEATMAYIFRGKLCGLICAECPEPLANVTVRLYRSRDVQNVTALAVASPKETFAILTDEQVKEKASVLIAEAKTDEEGNFIFELGDNKRYNGEAFEVDIYCGTVPRLKPQPQPPTPLQFSITTLQPRWRQTEGGFVAAWDYCLPYRFWCGVRGRFGAWTICGQVVHCETKAPIGGVRVRAFDVDWLQDDALGDAVTDGSGHFRIDYSAADFKQTIFSPFINIEWTGGPDLYFRVETLSGTPLLVEAPSRGRAPDRENAGPCFCVDLCLQKQPPTNEPLPVFDALGGYLYASAIHSAVPGSGLTLGDNRAFYSVVRLNGVLPKKLNGQPMEYRFEFRVTDASGNPTGAWTPIGAGQFVNTSLGKLERYAPAFPGDPNPIKTAYVYADPVNPGGGPLNAAIVGGWIRVPQFSNVFGPEGFFDPNGNMLNIVTSALVASSGIDVTGVRAGDSSTLLGAPFAQNKHIALRMRVREVGNPGSEVDAGMCFHVAIENTRYNGVAKGGSWAPSKLPDQLAVVSVDALQLRTNGCAGVTTGLDVVLTATHPNLGDVSLVMTGPGGPYGFTLPAATANERVGTASANGWSIATLPDCAYIITLGAQVLLTTGDSYPDTVWDQIGFCKK